MKKDVPPLPPEIQQIEKGIGLRLRHRRLDLGMTQQELAEKLGLSYQQIQKYETGLNRISAGRLFLVANILLTDMDYFFESPEKIQKPKKNSVVALTGRGIPTDTQAALINLINSLTKTQ